MRFAAGFLTALALIAIASASFIYSGAYDVAASSPGSRLERFIFNGMMRYSVVARANNIEAPPTFNDEMVRDGFEHYDEMCTVCHGGPDIDQSEISTGLNPAAPNLAYEVKMWTPRQLFWIVKHGVKMTAMPSFGATHTDEELWCIVAFIEKLPRMSPEQYQQFKHEMPAGSHEPGH